MRCAEPRQRRSPPSSDPVGSFARMCVKLPIDSSGNCTAELVRRLDDSHGNQECLCPEFMQEDGHYCAQQDKQDRDHQPHRGFRFVKMVVGFGLVQMPIRHCLFLFETMMQSQFRQARASSVTTQTGVTAPEPSRRP